MIDIIKRLSERVQATTSDEQCQALIIQALRDNRILQSYAIDFSFQYCDTVAGYGRTMHYAVIVNSREDRQWLQHKGSSRVSLADAAMQSIDAWAAHEARAAYWQDQTRLSATP